MAPYIACIFLHTVCALLLRAPSAQYSARLRATCDSRKVGRFIRILFSIVKPSVAKCIEELAERQQSRDSECPALHDRTPMIDITARIALSRVSQVGIYCSSNVVQELPGEHNSSLFQRLSSTRANIYTTVSNVVDWPWSGSVRRYIYIDFFVYLILLVVFSCITLLPITQRSNDSYHLVQSVQRSLVQEVRFLISFVHISCTLTLES
jgi:hypothetical protein